MIRCIGKELGFQAECLLGAVGVAFLSVAPLGDEVGSVEMDTGKRGLCFQGDAGRGSIGFGCGAECSKATVDYIIVVIAMGVIQLVEILPDVGADGGRSS